MRMPNNVPDFPLTVVECGSNARTRTFASSRQIYVTGIVSNLNEKSIENFDLIRFFFCLGMTIVETALMNNSCSA